MSAIAVEFVVIVLLIVANGLFSMADTPAMNRVFHTMPIPLPDFFLIGAVASLVLWAEETRKFFARRRAPVGGLSSTEPAGWSPT